MRMIVVIVVMMVRGSRRVREHGLRIERCLDRFNMPAQTFDHPPDHMIGADTDPIAQKLHR